MNSLNIHPTEMENHQEAEYPSIISGNNQNKLRTDDSWTDVNLNEDMQEKGDENILENVRRHSLTNFEIHLQIQMTKQLPRWN